MNSLWDGENILLETNSGNVIQAVYTLEPMDYGNLISQSRSGVDSFYLFDALGSARELASIAGSVTDSYLYNSWGAIVKSTGPTLNSFLFVGRQGYYYDIDSQDYYIRNRYYNPLIRSFFNIYNIYLNNYSYCNNNPLRYFDPSGNVGVSYTPRLCPVSVVRFLGRQLGLLTLPPRRTGYWSKRSMDH